MQLSVPQDLACLIDDARVEILHANLGPKAYKMNDWVIIKCFINTYIILLATSSMRRQIMFVQCLLVEKEQAQACHSKTQRASKF